MLDSKKEVPPAVLEILEDELENFYHLKLVMDRCKSCGKASYVFQRVDPKQVRTTEYALGLTNPVYVTKPVEDGKGSCSRCLPGYTDLYLSERNFGVINKFGFQSGVELNPTLLNR